jgi:hypothetical protein
MVQPWICTGKTLLASLGEIMSEQQIVLWWDLAEI